MAMQESGKGSGDGKAPVLSDEQAEQFAASFTPAWDTDDGAGDDTNGAAGATQVDPAPAPAAATAAATASATTTAANGLAGRSHVGKQTLIGTAPQANTPRGGIRAVAPSSEAIDPENILESNTAPQLALAPSVPPPAPAAAAVKSPQMKTQVMAGAPGPVAAKAHSKPAPAHTRDAKPLAVSADPFAARARSARSVDDEDFVPKKSKTLVFVIGGLAVAAAVGMIAKFGLSDDPPPAPPTQMVTGPAVATAEIPPPPPKVDTPAPAPSPVVAPVNTANTERAAAKAPEPLPAPTSVTTPAPPAPQAPQARSTPLETAPHSAPAAQPRQPRGAALPPPQAAAAPPPAAAQPKTPPKAPTTGIVRDNPF